MKRIFCFILMMLMCMTLFSATVYAENDIESFDTFKVQTGGKISADAQRDEDGELDIDAEACKSGPSVNDLLAIGIDGHIKMPHESYYLANYRQSFINDREYGLAVRVYKNPDNGIKPSNLMPSAWHGSEVTLIAKRHQFFCAIYKTNENQYSAGWIYRDDLVNSFPGKWYSVGNKNEDLFEAEHSVVNPEVEWADDFYENSYTEYSYVWGPGPCFAMTLDYQVIARNDMNPQGIHEVFYDSGDGWKSAGSFRVNEELDPVRYTIYFNKPVNVKAVAVLPEDLNQQGFDFRLGVVDYCYIAD